MNWSRHTNRSSIQIDESCHTHDGVMSHVWMSHVPRMNVPILQMSDKSYHTHEWIMSPTQICHDTHIYEACHTCKWVVSHTWMSHITHMNESCHTHDWVMSHIWSVTSHMNMYHSHEYAIPHTHHSREYVIPHTWICPVTHIHTWNRKKSHDSLRACHSCLKYKEKEKKSSFNSSHT